MWNIGGLYVDCMWIVCGLYVDHMWIACGLYMDYMWIIGGLNVDYMWIICGLYVDYMWIICGLYVDYMWAQWCLIRNGVAARLCRWAAAVGGKFYSKEMRKRGETNHLDYNNTVKWNKW